MPYCSTCLLGLLALLLAGCASQPVAVIPTTDDSALTRAQVVAAATRLLGVPYRYGGTSPSGMDCSGLVQYAYHQAGIRLPRTTKDQFQAGFPLTRVRPGDLLFFKIRPNRVSHVGIYVGDGKMIHASSGSRKVRTARLDNPYWSQRFVTGATFLSCAGQC